MQKEAYPHSFDLIQTFSLDDLVQEFEEWKQPLSKIASRMLLLLLVYDHTLLPLTKAFK